MTKAKPYHFISCCLLLICCAVLCVFFWNVRTPDTQSTEDGFYLSRLSLLGGRWAGLNIVSDEIRASRTRLSNLYFPDHRKAEAQGMLTAVKKKINLTPYDRAVWLDLLASQQVVMSDPAERIWAAQIALFINGWQIKYQAQVGLICLDSNQSVVKHDLDFCRRQLAPFNSIKTQRSLFLLDMDVKTILQNIKRLEADYCLRCDDR